MTPPLQYLKGSPVGHPSLIHCSYHKCLTQFYRRIFTSLLGTRPGGYRHFNSDIDAFYSDAPLFRVASVNNHTLDLDALGDCRVTRFVRDPRDLVVSGYFYHLRGSEAWTTVKSPTDDDWGRTNGVAPEALREGESYADCLRRLNTEEGLIAEMQYRRRQFDSMRHWPTDDPRIRVWRYEDVVGRESEVVVELLNHYGMSGLQQSRGRIHNWAISSMRRGRVDPHVRDPAPGQWRRVFTAGAEQWFSEHYGDLLELPSLSRA